MKNAQITFEVCSSTEWLRDMVQLDLEAVAPGWENEAADEIGRELHRRLRACGFQTISARGDRECFHGWNGAHTFTHKSGPIGTFDALTPAQLKLAEKCIDEAVAAAEAAFPREEIFDDELEAAGEAE